MTIHIFTIFDHLDHCRIHETTISWLEGNCCCMMIRKVINYFLQKWYIEGLKYKPIAASAIALVSSSQILLHDQKYHSLTIFRLA